MGYAEIVTGGWSFVCRDTQTGRLVVRRKSTFRYFDRIGVDKYTLSSEIDKSQPTIR